MTDDHSDPARTVPILLNFLSGYWSTAAEYSTESIRYLWRNRSPEDVSNADSTRVGIVGLGGTGTRHAANFRKREQRSQAVWT